MFLRTKERVVLYGYNSRTIYRYFKKQGAIIGNDCKFDVTTLGGEPYLVNIGNHVYVSSGVLFHTHDGAAWLFSENIQNERIYGPIIIEDNCIIGRNSQIMPNVHIGKNSVVGPGSVVISDVPPNSVVMGVPARPIGSLEKYKARCLERWSEQAPPEVNTNGSRYNSKKTKELVRKHLIELYRNSGNKL